MTRQEWNRFYDLDYKRRTGKLNANPFEVEEYRKLLLKVRQTEKEKS